MRFIKFIAFSLVCLVCLQIAGVTPVPEKERVIAIFNEARKKYSADKDISGDDSILMLEALTISIKINYTEGEAQYYDILGVHERNRSNYSQAIEYHQKAYRLIENTTCFPHFFGTPFVTLVNTGLFFNFGCPKK